MSNWLTLRLTERRSSARRAPIWYTPPVKPPPPRTSAVRDCERARARRFPVPFSSLTTLPIRGSVVSRLPGPGEVGVPGAHDDRLALGLVADRDAALLNRHQRAVTAVLDAPAGAADGCRRIAPAGAERALRAPEKPPHALLRALARLGDRGAGATGAPERRAGESHVRDELLGAPFDTDLLDHEAPAEELARLRLAPRVRRAADLHAAAPGVDRGADGDRLRALEPDEPLGRLGL